MTRDIRLSDYLHLLRRQRWVLIGVVAATTLVGIFLASSRPAVYSSSAAVRLTADASEGVFDSSADVDDNGRSRELLTEVEVITSSALRQQVLDRLGPNPPASFTVSAELVGFSEIIQISVRADSPVVAADVANVYVDAFIDGRRERAVGELTDQINGLRTQAAESSAQLGEIDARLADPDVDPSVADGLQANRQLLLLQLQQYTGRADELEIVADLRAENTERVSVAAIQPESVATPIAKTAIAAAVLGLLGGLGLAVVRDLVRDRLSDPDDLAAIEPHVPVLAAVPHMRTDVPDGSAVATSAAGEAYRYLRTGLQLATLETGYRVIAVTSAVSGEGKSTTALNLARAAATAGRRVAIIDCDLRRPSLHVAFGLEGSPGVVSVVLGEAPLAKAVSYPEPNIAAIPAGAPTTAATEILASDRFARLVASIAAQSDLTILDLPPVLPVADPLAVARVVDAAIVVARIGLVRRKEVAGAVRRLRDVGIPVVGVVVNDVVAPTALYGGHSPYVSSTPAAADRPSPLRHARGTSTKEPSVVGPAPR